MTQNTLFPGEWGVKGSGGPRKPLQGLSCARPGCDGVVEPQKRGGEPKRYCCTQCQQWAYDQTHPRVPVQNPDKQTRAEKILARLRQGPASGLDLLKAGGGTRYGARIHNLRELGYRIETDMPRVTGLDWPMYRLEKP